MNVDANARLKWIDKLKLIGLVVLIGGLLVGCGEASSEEQVQAVESVFNEALEDQEGRLDDLMPPGVKDGRVSQDTYLEVVRIIKELPIISGDNQIFTKQINDSYATVSVLSFKDEYGSFLNEYDVFIKGFNLSPKTDGDFELNDHMISIVLNTEMYIEHMRLYLKHESVDFKSDANGYLNKRKVSLDALVNSMDKYELFTE